MKLQKFHRSSFSSRFPALPALAALAAFAGPAVAQNPISRLSVDASGAQGNSDSGSLARSAISEDGRYVAFNSTATNLVANDTNGVADIFVREVLTGAIVRVSVDSAGAEADGYSAASSISKDGRFVAFESLAGNLVAGDTNGAFDIFVHDRDPDGNGTFDEGNGVTTRVSVRSNGNEGNFDSFSPSISGDGGAVAFASSATNLVPNDKNGFTDVFVHEVATANTTRISTPTGLDANGPSHGPSISSDGVLIAFSSFASNLISGDMNGYSDIYLSDRAAGALTRVSLDSSGGEGDEDSTRPFLSGDGKVVAFSSVAGNLVAGDTNFATDAFVHDIATGVTTRVSVDSNGTEGNAGGSSPALSLDGQLVAFESSSDNLTANDQNFSPDVFLHDRATAATECLTVNGVGLIANGFGSNQPVLSSDGGLVVFSSSADNLIVSDTNGAIDVFLRDRSVTAPAASWTNYGAGYPGSFFVPSLTASANPVFGSTISIDATNSAGLPVLGLMFFGLGTTSIPTNIGGTLLVDFEIIVPVPIPVSGFSVSALVPQDMAFFGLHVYTQMIEFDAGAAFGFSFTPGLDLGLGL